MSESTIDSENTSKPAPDAAKPKGTHKPVKKAKRAKRGGQSKKAAAKPNANRTNKKAEVIAMMKRAKGADASRDRAGSRIQSAASSAFWATREARRSNRPRAWTASY